MRVEPVGMREIAERLGVKQGTVSQWRARSLAGDLRVPMPEPLWKVSGHDAWNWREVEQWAHGTRRLTPTRQPASTCTN